MLVGGLVPANLLPPQVTPLLTGSVNSRWTWGGLVGISVRKSSRWLVECEPVIGACACLHSQTWEPECLISLERVLTYCWVGIGWGLSILSNNEKSEHSGICCWPDWHNLLLSELFLLMENLNQKSCCLAWHELTDLSSFSPGKPATELAVRTELFWAASLNWGCWTRGGNLSVILPLVFSWLPGCDFSEVTHDRASLTLHVCSWRHTWSVGFEVSTMLKFGFLMETYQILHEKNILPILYSFWKSWLWIFHCGIDS